MIVTALINGLKSIGFIAVILVLIFYMFAIGKFTNNAFEDLCNCLLLFTVGMTLFAKNDPWHFGSLHIALITLFRCATMDDWTDVMYINMLGKEMIVYVILRYWRLTMTSFLLLFC